MREGFWIHLGRLLPAEVRERIFEPSFHDLRASASELGSASFAIRAAGIFLDSLRLGLLSTLVKGRRPTRTGWALLLLALLTTLVAAYSAMIANYHQPVV